MKALWLPVGLVLKMLPMCSSRIFIFDHCGGATKREGDKIIPVFKNAKFWCSKSHWEWASVSPNPREKASFLEENLLPLKESGQLNLFDSTEDGFCSELGFDLLLVDGHTEQMALPKVQYKRKNNSVCFRSCAHCRAYSYPLSYGV